MTLANNVHCVLSGIRLAFNEAHGVNIPESIKVTDTDISFIQRLDTAGLHHKIDAVLFACQQMGGEHS